MRTVWILHYLNCYMLRWGVFESEQAAKDFVAGEEHSDWYIPVELPIQFADATWKLRYSPPKEITRGSAS